MKKITFNKIKQDESIMRTKQFIIFKLFVQRTQTVR